VLITPLEKFRKEQIGAAKVSCCSTEPRSPPGGPARGAERCPEPHGRGRGGGPQGWALLGTAVGGGAALLPGGHGDNPAPGKVPQRSESPIAE